MRRHPPSRRARLNDRCSADGSRRLYDAARVQAPDAKRGADLTEIAEIALVFALVIGLGYALSRLTPDPPNPVRPKGNFFAGNLWANTWWGGAGAVLAAPVLGYLEGVLVGAVMLLLGAVLIALSAAALRE